MEVRHYAEMLVHKHPAIPDNSLAIALRDEGYPSIPFSKIVENIRSWLDNQVGYWDHVVVSVRRDNGTRFYIVFFTSADIITAYRLQFTN